ncbi:MAG: permease-like cell division protein FtsX, partial [Xanthomonadaceae bacterium]|nr:permease-like cell division protein FtsX [Xanthomonadaceae bacterium]
MRAWREQHLYSLFSSLGRLAARPWATALTLAVLGFALALPLLFWLLLDNARGLAGNVGEAGAISAFLKPGTDVTAVQAFAARLRARADVAAVTVKTPEQGLDEFRERSGFADALKVLHYNPLPAVLIVDPRGDPGPLAAQLRADPAVDQVQYDAQWRQRLNAILVLALRGAQVLAGLLALAALLVIGNTVRQDIAGRSEEIAVMQLLGAEAGFVRRPFLYSGFW